MKKLLVYFVLLVSTFSYSQKDKSSKIGQTSIKELQMPFYEKDSSATAVILYEHANLYTDPDNDYKTRTDYYFRIKIFHKNAFELATINIPLYQKEKIIDIQAITYSFSENGSIKKDYISQNAIFSIKENDDIHTEKFTLPNVTEGSVIEYSYSIISPYTKIDDWNFQSSYPKIKSEFDAAILGNFIYNVKLVGFQELDKSESSIKKKCVYVDGLGEGGCIIYSFGMKDIPAFVEEKYMLSKKNYLSKITFDLKTVTNTRGITEKYTTTWKEADGKLKTQFFNNQTSKDSYFKKRIPENIFAISDELQKAKEIYRFIQKHFTWNGKNWTNEDAKLKDSFDEKVGNVAEINLSLYNSLKAADLHANLVVLATRNHGIPTKLFPVIYDFNYVIVRIQIDNETYYLDATDPYLAFGQVPVNTLNGDVRVLDFKNDGYWQMLQPRDISEKIISASLVLNENGDFSGDLDLTTSGYYALEKRKKIVNLTKEAYISDFEKQNPDVTIDNYKIENTEELEKKLEEFFEISISMEEDLTEKIRLNPFLFERLNENPFKLKERLYPVDFAFPYKETYKLSLKIPENYTITSLPENKSIVLPNSSGILIFKIAENEGMLQVYLNINIRKKIFRSEEYTTLKDFFNQIITIQKQFIVLEKRNN